MKTTVTTNKEIDLQKLHDWVGEACHSEDLKVLLKLAKKFNWKTTHLPNESRYRLDTALCFNENTPVDALKLLSNSWSSSIRSYVAGHRNISSEILVSLADDTDIKVRETVALNPLTPKKVIDRYMDEGWVGRCAAITFYSKKYLDKVPKAITEKHLLVIMAETLDDIGMHQLSDAIMDKWTTLKNNDNL